MHYFDRFTAWDWIGPYTERDIVPQWVIEELMADVQSSVEHQNGDDYPNYRKDANGYMRFGTQIVSVLDCVRTVLNATGLREEVRDELF